MINPKNFDEMWGNIRVLSIIIFIVTPPLYIILAHIKDGSPMAGGEHDMMFYMLLIVAVCLPAVLPLITGSQIRAFKRKSNSRMSRFQLVQSIFVQKAAVVISCYVFGMAVYFTSQDIIRLYYFYPIGIAWTFIYWPRREKYESLINELETT